jgi:hypothetical protein
VLVTALSFLPTTILSDPYLAMSSARCRRALAPKRVPHHTRKMRPPTMRCRPMKYHKGIRRRATLFHWGSSRSGSQATAGGFGNGSDTGLSPRNMACLRMLVAATMFLASTLGLSYCSSRALESKCTYVLTTARFRPVRPAAPGLAALGPNSGAIAKCGGVLAEGLAGDGQ